MKGIVRTAIISAHSNPHPSSSVLSCLWNAWLWPFYGLFYFVLFFFVLWEIYHCITGDNLPFCSIRRKKATQGYFKEEPTKIQWGSGNDEAPLCFQAGIQNYAINDTRHEGEKRDERKSKILVPRLVFQATTQRFMDQDDFRVDRTLQNL